MPTNSQTDSCIATERGALVFWAPPPSPRRQGTKVQIIDVLSLQVATGYTRDPQGKLLLEAQASVAAGRSWTLAKAAQLIRNDARPHRWVALELNKRAWGLFWAGGGIQRCREVLAERISETEACSALVPATPEALLRLMLDLEPQGQVTPGTQRWRMPGPAVDRTPWTGPNPWTVVAWTSLAWMAVLGITVAGFLGALERQDRKLDLLLERSGATSLPAHGAGSAP
ncbi:hypothetical protein [Synechococcus sp. LA31]|uniref:hypothetical protein n=1 Tax=Synechococcus sp. LA31 TaxID=2741953 RepID=UPI001BDC93E5|nr:hypothetical protein [Synechococcus sp. LA31]QVV67985.1 hypothetical protein KJJ24_01970 [Synechococcus sp. LA31]